MVLEPGFRPAPAGHAQQGRKAGVAADRVDGARDFGRVHGPAIGAGVAVVLVVVGPVFGQGHHKAAVHQAARQIGMHPGRTARAMRDDHQAPIATHRRALWRELHVEVPAFDRAFGVAGWVVEPDRAVLLRGRDFSQTNAGPGSSA